MIKKVFAIFATVLMLFSNCFAVSAASTTDNVFDVNKDGDINILDFIKMKQALIDETTDYTVIDLMNLKMYLYGDSKTQIHAACTANAFFAKNEKINEETVSSVDFENCNITLNGNFTIFFKSLPVKHLNLKIYQSFMFERTQCTILTDGENYYLEAVLLAPPLAAVTAEEFFKNNCIDENTITVVCENSIYTKYDGYDLIIYFVNEKTIINEAPDDSILFTFEERKYCIYKSNEEFVLSEISE